MKAGAKLFNGALVLLLAGAVVMIVIQRQTIAGLRADGEQLAKDAREAQELARQNADMPRLQTNNVELEALHRENHELLALRNQAGQLRRESADLENLRAVNHELLARQNSSGTARPALPADFVTRDALRDMGQATPENTVQTMFWALSTGNIRRLIQCSLNGEANTDPKQDLEAEAKEMAQQFANFPGFRIADRTNVSPTEVTLDLQSSPGGALLPMKLKCDGSGWKLEEH